MDILKVELGARSYPILIGAGLLRDSGQWRRYLPAGDLLVVTNEVVAPLYLESLCGSLGSRRLETLVLPDGEAHKTLATVSRILDALAEGGFHRDACVVALGGGVVGDMAGFAAACYQRGVNFAQVPTTLLAQVDSSVGGKTGVNHPRGKNLIGAFHQPVCVMADTETLRTLPPRELAAGLAEVVKYGLIVDAEFFNWLEARMEQLLALDADALAYAIRRSCEIKARVVAEDEREHGRRALLNLGHTFGHAYETAAGYGNWLHGEAVAAGMVTAARVSAALDMLPAAEVARIRALLERAGLPTEGPPVPGAELIRLMGMDKKVTRGRKRFILLEEVGRACIRDDVPNDLLVRLLATAGAA